MKVEITAAITRALKKRVEATNEFSDMDEYVNYILKQVVEKLEREKTANKTLSKKKEKEVGEQLKNLGYLD